MKFTIDTDKKEVQLQETVNVSDLLNKLQGMLGDEYTEYTIIPKIDIRVEYKEPKFPSINPLTPYVRTLENPSPPRPYGQEFMYDNQ